MLVSKHSLMRTALATLYHSGGHRLLAPITRGLGAILMLHRVSPQPAAAFDPNGTLRVMPDFLDGAIRLARAEGYECVSLDEARRRLRNPTRQRPFVAFTLDDGYRDNLEHAYPVFARHQVPFCIYVPTSYANGRGDLWWANLEQALSAGRTLVVTKDGAAVPLDCANPVLRQRAWDSLYWWLRGLDDDDARGIIRDLCVQAGVDPGQNARAMLTWSELATLMADPLCTIGAHTVHHYCLAKLDAQRCFHEMVDGKQELETRLGRPIQHFSYPYGSAADCGAREFELAAEAGFDTAVTTRKGLLFAEHRGRLMALPRLSLNGHYQDLNMLAVLLGGTPFALMNRFRRLAA